MAFELSDKVRAFAEHEYVAPARREGRKRFAIQVRDVWNSLVEREGFPRQNVPQVCNALRSRKFLNPLGLEIEKVEGPPSQTSTTVVFHYRFRRDASEERTKPSGEVSPGEAGSPIDKLYGLMRKEFAAYGGGEAFLKWLRTDPEKDRR
ncbi:MAG TPA: hypothetical protein VGS02_10100 [Acidobacteriaceae bacterium]|nr:hypothetical protein [Acidobacteriaceae bacterium]